jgi:hypothetical protein
MATAAFLAPLTVTVPVSGLPPLMMSFSFIYSMCEKNAHTSASAFDKLEYNRLFFVNQPLKNSPAFTVEKLYFLRNNS